MSAEFHTDDTSLPRSGYASDWSCRGRKLASTNQKGNPDLGGDASSVWNLRSFLTCHELAGKQVVAPPNVGCFLRLLNSVLTLVIVDTTAAPAPYVVGQL